MVDIKISDKDLENKLRIILDRQFDSDAEEMLRWVVHNLDTDFKKSDYRGILKWHENGLKYQKAVRDEWK